MQIISYAINVRIFVSNDETIPEFFQWNGKFSKRHRIHRQKGNLHRKPLMTLRPFDYSHFSRNRFSCSWCLHRPNWNRINKRKKKIRCYLCEEWILHGSIATLHFLLCSFPVVVPIHFNEQLVDMSGVLKLRMKKKRKNPKGTGKSFMWMANK